MMLILRDDQVVEVFESPARPPDWIEVIDVENNEYSFCDDSGQRYIGAVTRPVGLTDPGEFELRPEGTPDRANALNLVDRAVAVAPNKWFPDIAALRRHIAAHPAAE